ncbi:ABC transporter permease subunit, partial [Staphylococcus hyicus]
MFIPTWMNLLLKTYVFIGIFSQDGLIIRFRHALHVPRQSLLFTAPAFIILSAYIYIPFMLFPLYSSMKDINNQLFYAAQVFGANTFTTMQKKLFPLSKKGIKTGIKVTFIPALLLFINTRLIAGNKLGNFVSKQEEK